MEKGLIWAYIGSLFGIFLLVIMYNKTFKFIYEQVIPPVCVIFIVVLFVIYYKGMKNERN